jgi:hypothetical protein
VHSARDVELAAVAIAEELRHSYLLGFVPESLDGKFHRVRIVVKDCSRCHVRARAGFIAVPSAKQQEPLMSNAVSCEVGQLIVSALSRTRGSD